MLLRNLSPHSSTESGASLRLDLDWTRSDEPGKDALPQRHDPPAPAEIFLEMGFVVAAALGLAVVVGLAL